MTLQEEYHSYVADLLELPGIQNLDNYIQHSDITTYQHVCRVSYLTFRICKRFGWDARAGARAGILHDYVTYDWHEKGDGSHRFHGFRHPGFARENAKRDVPDLTPVEENAILRHMWPLTPIPPKYKEGWALTAADKYLATQETLQKYRLKR